MKEKILGVAEGAIKGFVACVALLVAFNAFYPELVKITKLHDAVFKLNPDVSPVAIAAGFSLLLFLVSLSLLKRCEVNVSNPGLYLLGFALWALLSALFAESPGMAFVYSSVDVLVVLVVVGVMCLKDRVFPVEKTLIAFVFGTLVITALAVYIQMEGVWFEQVVNMKDVMAPYGTWKEVALLFVLFVLFLQSQIGRGSSGYRGVVAVVLLMTGFAAGFARALFPLLVAGTALIVSFGFAPPGERSLRGVLSVLLVAGMVGGWWFSERVLPGENSLSAEKLVHSVRDKVLTEQQYAVLFHDPVFGSGRGLFSSRLTLYQSDELRWLNRQVGIANHEVRPLSLTALLGGETGFPGLLLFLIPFVVALRAALEEKRVADGMFFAGAMLLAIAGQGGSNPRFFPAMLIFAAPLMAQIKEGKTVVLKPSRVLFVFYTCAVIGLGFSATAGWRAIVSRLEMDEALKIRALRRAGELPGLFRAWRVNPLSYRTTFALGSAVYRYEGWDKARLIMSQVLKLYPHHGPALYIRARCERQLNDFVAYENDLRMFVKLYPYDPLAVPELARLFVKTGRQEEARSLLEKYLQKRPIQKRYLEKDPELRDIVDSIY